MVATLNTEDIFQMIDETLRIVEVRDRPQIIAPEMLEAVPTSYFPRLNLDSVVRIRYAEARWMKVDMILDDMIVGVFEDGPFADHVITFHRSRILDLFNEPDSARPVRSDATAGQSALPLERPVLRRSDPRAVPSVRSAQANGRLPLRHRRLHQVQDRFDSPPRTRD